MTDPIYISAYTPQYAEEAAGLIQSLDQFSLPHDVIQIPDLGSWALNCNQKPFVIGMMLMKYQRPVVWLDADARVEQKPDWSFMEGAEIGIAITSWWREQESLSGTIFFSDENYAIAAVSEWIRESIMNPNTWDQVLLGRSVGNLYITGLPPEYCAFDKRIAAGECKRDEVIIWHRQMSRELKQEVNRGT